VGLEDIAAARKGHVQKANWKSSDQCGVELGQKKKKKRHITGGSLEKKLGGSLTRASCRGQPLKTQQTAGKERSMRIGRSK